MDLKGPTSKGRGRMGNERGGGRERKERRGRKRGVGCVMALVGWTLA